MKRCISLLIILLLFTQIAFADETEKNGLDTIGDWFLDTAGDVGDWFTTAADDVGNWVTGAATDTWEWISGTAETAWKWTSNTAIGAWNGVTGFFDPPSTEGTPSVVPEPELPIGANKMYLGYTVHKTGLDNGYSESRDIGRGDPHFGMTLGKFYVSGFTSAISPDNQNFIFLKTAGDNVELHFELIQDIDMLGGDTFSVINSDDAGYDKYFGIKPTYFGRGTLIIRHIDYQNNPGEPQVYTDYLSAKMTGDANTVISLNEEGDYEVALDYEIKKESYVLGTKKTKTKNTDYQIMFRFSVRNGNCMIFPFDAATGEELRDTAITPNGFYIDMAYSRYLDVNVKRSVLVEQNSAIIEDVRFNRPAGDKEQYTQEGIYTIKVKNRYTGEETVKTLYVGNDEKYSDYVAQGMTVEQIIKVLQSN